MPRIGSRNSERSRVAEVWHYTPWYGMHAIIKSGFVRGDNEYRAKNWNVPVVWFSRNQKIEMTAGSGERANYFRIGCSADDPDLIPWPKLASDGRAKPGVRFHLERTGRSKGANPADWCGVIAEAVAIENLPIQFQVGTEWRSVDLESAAEALRVGEISVAVDRIGGGQVRVSVQEIGD
jgi:hypothetical protein